MYAEYDKFRVMFCCPRKDRRRSIEGKAEGDCHDNRNEAISPFGACESEYMNVNSSKNKSSYKKYLEYEEIVIP